MYHSNTVEDPDEDEMAPIFVKGFLSSQGPLLDSQHEGDLVLIFGDFFSSFQRSMLDFNDRHGRGR